MNSRLNTSSYCRWEAITGCGSIILVLATQILQKNQQWLLLQQRRSEQRRKSLGWLLSVLKYHTWTWAFIIWWGAISAAWGWIGGINTPMSVVCSTRTSLCYQARVWGTKVASADVPKPKCTKTRNGLVCLYPKRSPYKTRTHNQPK